MNIEQPAPATQTRNGVAPAGKTNQTNLIPRGVRSRTRPPFGEGSEIRGQGANVMERGVTLHQVRIDQPEMPASASRGLF